MKSLLDKLKTPSFTSMENQDYSAGLQSILKKKQFWKKTLCAEGEYAKEIVQHQTSLQVINFLKETGKRILTKVIPVPVATKIVRCIDEVGLKDCEELFNIATGEDNWCQAFQQIKDDLFQARSIAKAFKEFIRYYAELYTKVTLCDTKLFEQYIQERSLQLENNHKFMLIDATKAGPLQEMTEDVKKICPMGKSAVFLNFCNQRMDATNLEERQHINSPFKVKSSATADTPHYNLPELFSLPDEDHQIDARNQTDLPNSTGISITDLVNFLAQDVMSDFHDAIQPYCKAHNIRVVDVASLFGNNNIEKELDIIGKHLNCRFPKKVCEALRNYQEFQDVKIKAKDLSDLMKTFKLKRKENDILSDAIHSVLKCEENKHIQLFELSKGVEKLRQQEIDAELWEVISELTRSKTLLNFLNENFEEDFRNLIDAVEEHAESLVREAEVSHLIEVKRFVQPLILMTKMEAIDSEEFILRLRKSCDSSPKDINDKLKRCNEQVYALKALYANVANRGEMTKTIIRRLIEKGQWKFVLEDTDFCEMSAWYKHKHEQTHVSLHDLNDLRSRALLIVNKDKEKEEKSKNLKDTLSRFIDISETVQSIVKTCTELHAMGHFSFRKYNRKVKQLSDLEQISKQLSEEKSKWETILENARSQYYFLNFVYSDQLWTLYDFFTRGNNAREDIKQNALAILRFIDPTIQLQDIIHSNEPSVQDKLEMVGEKLKKLFSTRNAVYRPLFLPENETSGVCNVVKPGEIFVIQLDPGNLLVVSTILKLYACTTQCYPEAHQLLFCSYTTTWEEIHLLLQRCTLQGKINQERSLFCIANVELLSNDLQFALVDEIKDIFNESAAQKDFFLSIVCRGQSTHPILDQFSENTHKSQPMFQGTLASCLQALCPEVTIITSSFPGLGKTEQVCNKAVKSKQILCQFPISGPFNKSSLIDRLQQRAIKKNSMLHFDVAEVDDAEKLDTFLFEMIVLRTVSSGTKVFHLPTKSVIIEVANTLKSWLKDALVTCTSFTREHLEWNNFDDYVVSQEILSPVQVVCQYFDALEGVNVDAQDIYIFGQHASKALSEHRCKELLKTNLSLGDDMTFSIAEVFLNVLADQLRKLSSSTFFRTKTLRDILGDETNTVKSTIVLELIKVYKEFSSRSVKSYRETQSEVVDLIKSSSLFMTAASMVDRTDGMIRWNESNHLLVVFHSQDFNTVSALYRKPSRVPKILKDLFKSQLNRDIPNYKSMTQEALHTVLEKVVRSSHDPLPPGTLPKNYALTPDNLLKMVLIFLRIKAGIPVIAMGETGCGKTSLISYLAKTCQCELQVFNFHAGIKEKDILQRVSAVNEEAKGHPHKSYWLFLDEINTCDHLGLVNEILCHKSIHGKALMPNIVLLAACNPYRLREEDQILTAGLEGKTRKDECSKLVYRVNPLPESMIDYVWDYGFLSNEDEKSYISRMSKGYFQKGEDMLVELLSTSQQFIRNHDKNAWCVSLRDVKRCLIIMKWFAEFYLPLKADCEEKRLKEDKIQHNAIILGLAHCYNSRLPTTKARRNYYIKMASIMHNQGIDYMKDTVFGEIIRNEQETLLNKMDLPESTAKNTALRENVFVILVCILNKIPIFVVGKPGCSKSLSVQLIRSNLRGQDSKDNFFKKLPQLYVVSYQGSESSTSRGIMKVFNKAKRYKEHTTDTNVLPVVLLDEIGLAEQSRFNPLKVLHSLLEPVVGEFPDIAVVGISNWALDAAKMNRANHLSKPEPDQIELQYTAVSISTVLVLENMWQKESQHSSTRQRLTTKDLKAVSSAYYEYQKNQRFQNFHGLRDYYSLIKYLCNKADNTQGNTEIEQWKKGLLRNFGGLQSETHGIVNKFMEYIDPVERCEKYIPIKDLVKENINDKLARHLMLITHGDSALGILENYINLKEREHEIIFGSRFEEDLSEDYSYRILSRIILCMERGVILVLKDLDNIYGSLYDMLNQNYTIVGKKNNCRIALGPYSNPMCQVHDDFRCIVLVDKKTVDYSDPPFLNRFEKQMLTYADVLTQSQKKIILELDNWVKQISTVDTLKHNFTVSDAFIGYCEDTLSSLVLHCWSKQEIGTDNVPEEEKKELVNKCKRTILCTLSPDAMLRASKSELAKENQEEVSSWQHDYFNFPFHAGLKYFLASAISKQLECIRSSEEGNIKLIIQTRTNIMFNTTDALQGIVSCQTVKLGAFKSEKQLTNKIRQFWFEADKEMLILQCKPSLDGVHMLMAKALIDNCYSEFKQIPATHRKCITKHVCIIIHIDREPCDDGWQFNFLSGWDLITIDSLSEPRVPVPEVLGKSVISILEKGQILNMDEAVKENLLWAFTCITYAGKSRSPQKIQQLLQHIAETDMPTTISSKILEWIKMTGKEHHYTSKFDEESWQIRVASDSIALTSSSTLLLAFTAYILKRIREPLVMIVYKLESCSAWCSYLMPKQRDIWRQIWNKPEYFNIDDVPAPQEVNSYQVNGVPMDMKFPFSITFINKIEESRDLFLEGYHACSNDPENVDEFGELLLEKMEGQQNTIAVFIKESVPVLFNVLDHENVENFLSDFCQLITAKQSYPMEYEECIQATRWAITLIYQHCVVQDPGKLAIQVITNYWCRKVRVHSILRLMTVCKEVSSTTVTGLMKQVDKNKTLGENQSKILHSLKEAKYSHVYEDSEGNDSFDEQTHVKVIYSTEEEQPINKLESITVSDNVNDVQLEHEDQEEETRLKCLEYEEDSESVNSDGMSSDTEIISENSASSDTDQQENHSSEEEIMTTESEVQEDDFTLEDTLVSVVCQKMLPTENVTSACGGVEKWQHKVNLVLSVASDVSSYPPIFHFLRVCNDFAVNILLPYELDPSLLSQIAETYDKTQDILQSNILFHKVMDVLKNLVQDNMRMVPVIQRFLCMFLGRCYDAGPNSTAIDQFLEKIPCGDIPDTSLACFGPVVDRLLIGATKHNPWVYFELLTGSESIQKFENMTKIQNAIAASNTGYESPLAVIVCDIIENVLYNHIQRNLKVNTIKSDDAEEYLNISQTAQKIVQETKTRGNSMKLIVAVAYLKSFLRTMAKLLSNPKLFLNTDEYDDYLQRVSPLFANPSTEDVKKCRNEAITHFFLKALRTDRNFGDIHQLCSEYTRKLPHLQYLPWKEEHDLSNPLAYHVMSKESSYTKALSSYLQLLKGDVAPMKLFISTAASTPETRMSLLAVLIDNVYLVSAHRKLKEIEISASKTLSSLITDEYDLPYQCLVKKLTTQDRFGLQDLELFPTSTYDEVQKASILAHLLSLVISHSQFKNGLPTHPSLLAKALFNPALLKSCYIPSSIYGNEKDGKVCTEYKVYSCKCWHRITAHQQVVTCCVCDSKFEYKKTELTEEKSVLETAVVAGYTMTLPKHDFPRNMTQVSYFLCNLLLHGALLAGSCYTQGNSIEYIDEITKHFLTDNIHNNDNEDMAQTKGAKWCRKRFSSSWESLSSLLGLPGHNLCIFIHVVLQRLRNQLIADIDLSTPEQQIYWENLFTQDITEIAKNRHRLIRHTLKDFLKVGDANTLTLESNIDELHDFNAEQKDSYLPSLFRVTPEKCLENFRGLYRATEQQNQHPFLSYFFSHADKLGLIQCMIPILKWQKDITLHKGHHITRKDARKSIKECIHDAKSTEKRNAAIQKSFKEFADAWNVNKKLFKQLQESDCDIPELQSVIHEDLPLEECVASTKQSTIFKVIAALAKMQNAFLDKMAELAASSQSKLTTQKCIAVSFLVRGHMAAAVPIVPLHEAKPNHIVQCNWKSWKDKILKNSQYNTEYGLGHDIQYDFGKIETELSNRLVLGKTFLLVNDSFPLFSFARELQSYTSILVHAEKAVPQQPLTGDIAKGVQEKHKSNPGDTSDLLSSLDVVLRTLQGPYGSIQAPSLPLVEYANKWYSVLCKEFPKDLLPEPSDSVKLSHIVALYEHLEELLFDKIEEKLPDKYRESLAEEIDEQLRSKLGLKKTSLEQILKVLRRFIFRYMSTSEDRTPDPTLHLATHLETYSKEPCEETDSLGAENELSTIFPPHIKIAHIHDVVKLTEKMHNEIQDKAKSFCTERKQKDNITKAKNRRQDESYSWT